MQSSYAVIQAVTPPSDLAHAISFIMLGELREADIIAEKSTC